MPAVISGTYTSGFTLSVNPTTITGAVETTGSYAVANLTHAGFSLVNDGTLEGNAYGVKLRDGSTLINNAGALISAVSSAVGIYLSGGILYPQFQVYNNGNIEGGSLITQFQHAGVYILARGSIVNGTLVQSPTVAGTFINGPNGVVTGDQGVRASNAEIINNGTIFSDLPVAYNGPDIGLVQNYGTFINGTHGVLLDGADTNDDIINNFGSIGGGVFLGGTAAVTNAPGATITNYRAERGGIEMDAGSQSYNYKGTVTTTISDPTVTNYGFIGGLNGVYEGTGVFINKGIVVGAGTLASHSGLYAQDHGNGISLYANRAAFSVTQGVTNDLGATIIGARYGAFMSVNGNYSTKIRDLCQSRPR